MKDYIIGLTGSLVLTSLAFLLVAKQMITAPALVGLGVMQAALQLRYFLHLGQEPKPKWESLIFYFMLLLLLIVALGTLWIMYDLNERMMMTHD